MIRSIPGGRMVLLKVALLSTVLVTSGCGGWDGGTQVEVSAVAPSAGPTEPPLLSIVECGIGALTGPLAAAPNTLRRAAQVYELVDRSRDVEAALVYVGKGLSSLTPQEREEALVIVSGLDACAEVSPMLGESARRALSLLGPPATIPDPSALGPALCPGIDPFGDPSTFVFEPDCASADEVDADQGIEGEYALIVRQATCIGLNDCGTIEGEELGVHFAISNCSADSCTIENVAGVWSTVSALMRDGDGWRATGVETADHGFYCYDDARASAFVLAFDVSGGGEVSGTYTESTANPVADCPDAEESFTLLGRRR